MSVRSYCRTAIKLFSKGFIFANPRLAAASASTVHPPRQYWDCAYFSGIGARPSSLGQEFRSPVAGQATIVRFHAFFTASC